jgi:hypothetical protein
MTMNDFATAWNEFYENNVDNYDDLETLINDFCNIHATSYEEYNAMWAILEDAYISNSKEN